MKKLLILVLTLMTAFNSIATNYYFSSSTGNDSYVKNSSTTPWRSLNKLNTIRPKPNDKFLLKSNDYFYGSLITNSDGTYDKPISITTYGGNSPAIINGVSLINAWTTNGNGIWYTQVQGESDVRNVIMDNAQMPKGRYPNEQPYTGGFLVYESFINNIGTTTINSQQLPNYGIDSTWNGATIAIKSYLSTLENGEITSIKGTSLTFKNNNMFYQVGYNNAGYFITNSIKTLDRLGEWYYNPSEKRLYMFFGSDNPLSHRVEVSTIDILFQPRNSNYAVKNIVFRGANKYGISSNWASRYNLSLSNIQVLKSGITAIALANITKTVINHSIIDGANTTGINLGYKCDSSYFLNSSVNNIGLLTSNIYCDTVYQKRMGYGIYSDQSATKGLHVENSNITNTAYIGIFITGSNNFIYRNYIANTCLLLDDGGAIYYGGYKTFIYQNNVIRRNIILNCQGYTLGFPSSRVIPNSIFVDDNGDNVIVDSNYINGSGQSCIMVHNGYNVTIWNNVFLNASLAAVMAQDDGMGGKVLLNIQHNQLCNPSIYRYLYIFYCSGNSTDNNFKNYGIIDNNYLVTPTIAWGGDISDGDDFSIAGIELYTFQRWKAETIFDHKSVAVDIKDKEIQTYYAIQDSTIHLVGTWSTPTGKIIKDSLKLKNHTGIFLIKKQP